VLLGGTVASVEISCVSGAPVGHVELAETGHHASAFSYNTHTNLYQFNWKTDRRWEDSCRRLLVRLDDGTVHTADFRMK
jgi:hypothetical protein